MIIVQLAGEPEELVDINMRDKTNRDKQKLFVVKKYIMANSAQEALKKENKYRADDCWVDEDWRNKQKDFSEVESSMGFKLKI